MIGRCTTETQKTLSNYKPKTNKQKHPKNPHNWTVSPVYLNSNLISAWQPKHQEGCSMHWTYCTLGCMSWQCPSFLLIVPLGIVCWGTPQIKTELFCSQYFCYNDTSSWGKQHLAQHRRVRRDTQSRGTQNLEGREMKTEKEIGEEIHTEGGDRGTKA